MWWQEGPPCSRRVWTESEPGLAVLSVCQQPESAEEAPGMLLYHSPLAFLPCFGQDKIRPRQLSFHAAHAQETQHDGDIEVIKLKTHILFSNCLFQHFQKIKRINDLNVSKDEFGTNEIYLYWKGGGQRVKFTGKRVVLIEMQQVVLPTTFELSQLW